MALFYGLVARGTTVLAEHLDEEELPKYSINSGGESSTSQAPKIARYILREKVVKKKDAHKSSFKQKKYNFYFRVDEFGICVMVVTQTDEEEGAKKPSLRIAFQCVDDIFSELMATQLLYHSHEEEGELNDLFARTIQTKLEFWNDSNSDLVSRTVSQVGSVKKQLEDVVEEQIVQRADAIHTLEKRASEMGENTALFAKSAKDLEKKIWWQQKRFQILMGVCCIVTVLVVLILLVLFIKVLNN